MQTEMHSKIVGISFREEGEDRQLNARALQPGQRLFWKHEMDNKFDPCAIKVYADEQMTKALGYLQRDLARDLVELMRTRGYKYEIFVKAVTGGGGRTFGCNIRVVATEDVK